MAFFRFRSMATARPHGHPVDCQAEESAVTKNRTEWAGGGQVTDVSNHSRPEESIVSFCPRNLMSSRRSSRFKAPTLGSDLMYCTFWWHEEADGKDWETAQWVKYSPHKYEDLNSHPQNLPKARYTSTYQSFLCC